MEHLWPIYRLDCKFLLTVYVLSELCRKKLDILNYWKSNIQNPGTFLAWA